MAFGSRRVAVTTLAAALAGLLLFALTLRQAGVETILAQLSRMGWVGFAGIVVVSGLRLAVRALAWTACVDRPDRLPLKDAWGATLMGEALGAVTPLATVLSEPAKAILVRHQLPLGSAIAALLIENIVYAASVALMIVAGATAFLVSFAMPHSLRIASLAAIAAMGGVLAAAAIAFFWDTMLVSRILARLSDRGVLPKPLAMRLEKLRRIETRVGGFARSSMRRFARVIAYEAAFHILGVTEVFVVLWLLAGGQPPALLSVLILESTGRLINVVFRLVPMRLGVDEAGSALLTRVIGLGSAAGATLALTRKARILVWTAVGIGLLLRRGLTLRGALDQARQVEEANSR